MKKIATIILCFFFLGSISFAWENPCSVIGNVYEYGGYTLSVWTPADTPVFGPIPDCRGTVILFSPGGQWHSFDYAGNGDFLTIAGILCRVSSHSGNLVCKVITQPEESTSLTFNVKD